ncbi:hypothetical protein AAFC00_006772 [Neodothiora populina]|uniref:Calcium permease n=1 Tax=Neodothiora populina TaxID=2781224 RepID=A0ABR3PB97_9PEZI
MADSNGNPSGLPSQEEADSSSTRPETKDSALDSTTTSPGLLAPQASSSATRDAASKRPRPGLGPNYGSISTKPASSSSTPRTPKKPSLPRRTSSNTPYRGQEFSVDDAHDEVEQDQKLNKATTSTSSAHMLRRKASTLRRRPAAQAPALPRVESDEREDHEPPSGSKDKPKNPPSDDTDDTLRPEDEDEEVARLNTATGNNGDDDDQNDDDDDDDDDINQDSNSAEDGDDADLSDAESFTLKDRQEAINETHPFGIRIWKPALYKKDRSVQANAEGDIHSTPGGNVSTWLSLSNILWSLLFGWWLALASALGALVCFLFIFAPGSREYGAIFWNFAGYIFYPFGKYVKLEHDEAYLDEDQAEGRSISEYERWQTGDLEEGRLFFGPTSVSETTRSLIGRRRDSIESANETDSLLGRPSRRSSDQKTRTKNRLFGRGQWTAGRIIFFVFFYGLVTPLLFFASGICWFLVFTIPMGRVTILLFHHLRRHPLALSFHSDGHYSRDPNGPSSSVLLCTYRAVGSKYWKYTVDGTNIFLINLLSMVAFAIFDFYVLRNALEMQSLITSSGFIFILGLFSIIPLAYFIGQAVASISAQSSMGVGATINAFFSTIVEVFLYCVALNQGKAQLVEGSIIGSIFAGILFLPGLSMCFGAIKRKTQRFNVRSAGVTSTMLLFAVIGSFSPTLFYQIYGSHELNCHHCRYAHSDSAALERDCRRCYFNQAPALHDRFFNEAVRPYIWFAAVMLFFSYVIGLLFTLRTHAAVIWNNEFDEKKVEKMEQAALHAAMHPEHRPIAGVVDPYSTMTRQNTSNTTGSLPKENIRDSQLYKRILGQSLRQAGLPQTPAEPSSPVKTHHPDSPIQHGIPHLVPPKNDDDEDDRRSQRSLHIHGLSAQENSVLVRQVAEMAATAAAVAARDAARMPRRTSQKAATTSGSVRHHHHPHHTAQQQQVCATASGPAQAAYVPVSGGAEELVGEAAHASGGHDAPNWSRTKSAVILLTATIAYAIIAEILVDTVDSVLEHVDIDEKFLGITLFALVPNTTEFLNAISFAMNGNIALSMEIGSAYALQVMLLQVPALVLYSTVHSRYIDLTDIVDHTFTLIFPQWDMVTVILGVFLMGWVVGEGKSNYFKGSILILAYLVIIMGFWFSGYESVNLMDVDPLDTLAMSAQSMTFKTVGQGRSGMAY